jgi:16S rRNA (adenine1518-N6/adenine1519-N6)-dimethyltransferase
MTLTRIRSWLEEAGVRPSRRMGQSFLTDEAALRRIASRVLAGGPRWILEIGAGPGNLTEHLVAGDGHVLALERDRRLARLCARRLAGRENLTVIMGDALSLPLDRRLPAGTITAAGNIPYSITGEIIRTLGEDLRGASRAVLLVQKETARRLAAEPGQDGYGAFTILTRAKWDVSTGFDVRAGNFYPRPEVDSRLVVLERPDEPTVKPALYPLVRRLVHEAFQRRRKTLANGLRPFFESLHAFGDVRHVIQAAGLDPEQRPETVPLQAWVYMAQALRGVVR